jgi:chymotrypsin
MIRSVLITLLLVSSHASAVVIRADVDDAKYKVQVTEFPALADMPGEGHGVLIAPHWVVTAAHAITWQSEIKQVMINGKAREVERIVIHSGYKKPPHDLLQNALATWDWSLFMVLLSSSDDIALIKLVQPVSDVKPVSLHQGDEFGRTMQFIGKGATGTGATGYDWTDPHRTELRRAYNKVTSAEGRWFCSVFDQSPEAHPLEGSSGSGDSGGPVLIETEKGWQLAGLTSWTAPIGVPRTSKPGKYGQTTCNVRLQHYKEWIAATIGK